LRLHQFTLSEFAGLKNQWQELLTRSNADALFMSWHWMYSWWEVYGNLSDDELLLLGVYDDDDVLVCIAPFYISTKKIKNLIPIKILQFIGTRVYGSSGFRTEYLQFIVDKSASTSAIQKILSHLSNSKKFNELWLNDLVVDSPTYQELKNQNSDNRYYKRLQSTGYSYGINVNVDIDDYVSSLGKNTRLKTFNRRKVLEKLGDVNIETIDNKSYELCLNTLSEFHKFRWDEYISYEKNSQFICKLIENSNINISGVLVKLDSEIIGCTFDILCKERSYNIQSGYKENVDKKIAMGSLTIGYAIEQYCLLNTCHYYDFLAGEGKKSNYKERIAKPEIEYESAQFISSSIFRHIYKLKDKLF